MKIANINQFVNGWFAGAFSPALYYSPDCEVGYHRYPKGFIGATHLHKIATEINYIIHGKLQILSEDSKVDYELSEGWFFIYHPNEVSRVVFLEDTELIVVKLPSIPSDKYIIGEQP